MMSPRHAFLAILVMGLTTVAGIAQSARFRTVENGEWNGAEHTLNGFAGPQGPTSGTGTLIVYDEHGEPIGDPIAITWEKDGDDINVFQDESLSRTFSDGMVAERGEIQGTSATWVNIDFA